MNFQPKTDLSTAYRQICGVWKIGIFLSYSAGVRSPRHLAQSDDKGSRGNSEFPFTTLAFVICFAKTWNETTLTQPKKHFQTRGSP